MQRRHALFRVIATFSVVAFVLVVFHSNSDARQPARKPAVAQLKSGKLPWRLMSGLEVLRLNAQTLMVSRGSAVDNGANGWILVRRLFPLDIRKIGAGGRDDVATPFDIRLRRPGLTLDSAMPSGYRASARGKPAEGWYHIVYLADPLSGESSAILTRQVSSMRTDRPGDARAPKRFTLRRHAPVAYYYDAKTGFRPMICYGWPMPMCVYTSAGVKDKFTVVRNMSAPKWKKISLEKFMPDTARIIRLQAVVEGVSGGGSAWARTLPNRPGSVLMGNG